MIKEGRTNLLMNSGVVNPHLDKPDTKPASYIFSYHVPKEIPVLVRRPWWNFWGRDSIELKSLLMYQYHAMSKEEGEFLESTLNTPSAASRVLMALAGKPSHIQLECVEQPTQYIPTTTQRSTP